VGTGTLGVGVGVGEAVGVGVGVGDDVCARASSAVIVRTESRTTAAAMSLVSPRIPLFTGFIDGDARHMNPNSETAKPPATAKNPTDDADLPGVRTENQPVADARM